MTRRVAMVLTCDWNGCAARSDGDRFIATRKVVLDGRLLESEMCDEHWGRVLDRLVPFTDVARVCRSPAPARRSRRTEDREQAREIRDWAERQPGRYELSPRGRLPAQVVLDWKNEANGKGSQ